MKIYSSLTQNWYKTQIYLSLELDMDGYGRYEEKRLKPLSSLFLSLILGEEW